MKATKETKLSCDTCGGEVVYEDRSEWDNYQAHQRLHKAGCDYWAHCHPTVYAADVPRPGGEGFLHRKGEALKVVMEDADGNKHEGERWYVEQYYVCGGIPLRTELLDASDQGRK